MPAVSIADLNKAKQDVDHIAELSTSRALTATDRLGNTKDTLAGAVYKISAFNDRGPWVTGQLYAVKDLVSNGGTWYVCVAPHTSGETFAGDVATKWRVYQGVTAGELAAPGGAAMIGYTPSGVGAVATTVQAELRRQQANCISVKDFPFYAKGDGVSFANPLGTDDTAAIKAAIATGQDLHFPPGFYNVTDLNFNQSSAVYTFDNAVFVLTSSTPRDYGIRISGWNCDYWNFKVHLNWNENYTSGVQWYNAAASSQYNTFFGFEQMYGFRGLVYGELPGNTSTLFAQSENQIYGFKTRGVRNPFYGNHGNGVLFFSEPIFAAHNEEWAGWAPSKTFDWSLAEAYNNQAGVVVVHGGEIQKAGSNLGNAAVLANTRFIGTVIESACPIQIAGGENHIVQARHTMTTSAKSQYVFASYVSGAVLRLIDCKFRRPSGVGASDRTPLVDASAASATNEIHIKGGDIEEWYHSTVTANAPLVKGGTPKYTDVRLRMTAADTNVYQLNNVRESLVENRSIDHLGYQTTGWYLVNDFGGGTTFGVVADAPAGYLSSCLELNATGTARAITVDETNAATIRSTGFRVRPGELYSIETWLKASAGSGNVMLTAKFYSSAGAALTSGPQSNGEYFVADAAGTLTGTAWAKPLAMIVVPANAAYMAIGMRCNTSTARMTDVRLRRAS